MIISLMKKVFAFLILCAGLWSCAQKEEATKLSPAMESDLKLNAAEISVKYSSPQKRGREIWGDLVPYGEIWRTGADEATVLETSKTLYIGNDSLPAGKYSLFTIPHKDEWTFIVNKEWEQWGAFNYDESKDVLRFTAAPHELESSTEGMSISLLEESDTTGELKLVWGKLQVAVGFSVPQQAENMTGS